MFQVIVRHGSIHLGQYFFTDEHDARDFKETIQNNFQGVRLELVAIEPMDCTTALEVANLMLGRLVDKLYDV